MARTGRPRIIIDWKQFDALCMMFCTQEEIAGFFKTSVDTIERLVKREKHETFAEYYKKASSGGKASLRRAQYKAAVTDENPTMLIWLGKQYLGQTDKQETEHKGTLEIKSIFQELADIQNVTNDEQTSGTDS